MARNGVREIELRIAPSEMKTMRRGGSYRLVPVNTAKSLRWRVSSEVRVAKP